MDLADLSEYEKERERTIQKNKELLKEYQIDTLKEELKSNPPSKKRKSNNQIYSLTANKKLKFQPRTQSPRIRGLPPTIEPITNTTNGKKNEVIGSESLLTCEEYCELNGFVPQYISSGEFIGEVNPEVAEEFGIGESKRESPKAVIKSEAYKTARSSGFSVAKATSKTKLKSNPNAYFYRHTRPGFEHKGGDFTEEEIQCYLDICKQFGSGTKWGLFASYMKYRVGYQCSNFYKNHMIPKGLISDPRFRVSKDGRAFFVG